jgi:hypothetical protein
MASRGGAAAGGGPAAGAARHESGVRGQAQERTWLRRQGAVHRRAGSDERAGSSERAGERARGGRVEGQGAGHCVVVVWEEDEEKKGKIKKEEYSWNMLLYGSLLQICSARCIFDLYIPFAGRPKLRFSCLRIGGLLELL